MLYLIIAAMILLYIAITTFTHGFLYRYWDIEDYASPDIIFPAVFWPLTLVISALVLFVKYMPVHQFGEQLATYLKAPRKVRVNQKAIDDRKLHTEAMQEVEETLDQNNYYMK